MNLKIDSKVSAFFTSAKFLNITFFLVFTLLMTAIVASQNFFFQRIVENGISKKDVIATQDIKVIDTKKTEKLRQEVAQKVEPVLTITEDDFIKDNLVSLENSVIKIKKKNIPTSVKFDELSLLFDIPDKNSKSFVLNYLMKVEETDLKKIFEQSQYILVKILNEGVSESEFENDNINGYLEQKIAINTPKNQSKIIVAFLSQVITPNLVIDEVATEAAKKNAQSIVKPYEVEFLKGERVLFEGEPVTKLKRDALRALGYNVLEINFKGFLGMWVMISFVALIFLFYKETFEKNLLNKNKLLILATLSLCMSFIAVFVPTGFSPYALPFPAYVIILSVFINPRVAFVSSVLLLGIVALGLHYDTQFLITSLVVSLVSAIAMSKIQYSKRIDLIKAGVYISISGFILGLGVYTLEKFLVDIDNLLIIRDTTLIALNGLVSAIIALGVLPVLENIFGIITPYGLIELADHNQPLLKRLQFEAPGTYHHSLMVANLCEAAAEAVGANPVLARVGAFYHDIGKLKRPLFFVENQSYFGIENPHTKLNPRLSKMVITAHPKDGVEVAKEYKLPNVVQDFILQHHGEGLASYFYNQAINEEGIENVKEEQFRYTGPKPQTKETAILMMADAVESAVRSLKNPTPEEIEAIINKIIVERLNDGQLSDSPLTLKDLKTIEITFNRILRGMQHNRIKYHQDMVQELHKNKIVLPAKTIDKELEDKIEQLENNNDKSDD